MSDKFAFFNSNTRNTMYLVSWKSNLSLNLPSHPKTANSLAGIGCFRSARYREQNADLIVLTNFIQELFTNMTRLWFYPQISLLANWGGWRLYDKNIKYINIICYLVEKKRLHWTIACVKNRKTCIHRYLFLNIRTDYRLKFVVTSKKNKNCTKPKQQQQK